MRFMRSGGDISSKLLVVSSLDALGEEAGVGEPEQAEMRAPVTAKARRKVRRGRETGEARFIDIVGFS